MERFAALLLSLFCAQATAMASSYQDHSSWLPKRDKTGVTGFFSRETRNLNERRSKMDKKYEGNSALSKRLQAMRTLQDGERDKMKVNYHVAEDGKSCEHGFTPITSRSVCATAQYYLGGRSDIKVKQNKTDRPQGCTLNAKTQKVTFNIAVVEPMQGYQLYCEKAEMFEKRKAAEEKAKQLTTEKAEAEAAKKEADAIAKQQKEIEDQARFQQAWQLLNDQQGLSKQLMFEQAKTKAEQKAFDDYMLISMKAKKKQQSEEAMRDVLERKTAKRMKVELDDQVQEVYMHPPSVDMTNRHDGASSLGLVMPDVMVGSVDTPKEDLGFGPSRGVKVDGLQIRGDGELDIEPEEGTEGSLAA